MLGLSACTWRMSWLFKELAGADEAAVTSEESAPVAENGPSQLTASKPK